MRLLARPSTHGRRLGATVLASVLALAPIALLGASPASADPPTAPSALVAAPTNVVGVLPGTVEVSWAVPADGGSPITTYEVDYSTSSDMSGATSFNTDPSDTAAASTTISGLALATTYYVTVEATNEVGTAPTSPVSVGATTYTLPSAPAMVSATPGNMLVSLVWTAPVSDGGAQIRGYVATCTSPGEFTRDTNVSKPFLGTKVPGLNAGHTYSCTVAAVNYAGQGPSSAPITVVADRLPGTPALMTATPGDGQITVAWSPPVTPGISAILSYGLTCTHVVGGVNTPVSIAGPIVSPVVVTGLDNGTIYTCKLTATNAVGTGAASSRVVTPRTKPNLMAVDDWQARAGSVTVTWEPPADTGGSPITGYVVTCINGATSRTVNFGAAARTGTVTGLTNNVVYYCSIAAKNVAGTGPATVAEALTPRPAPTKPSGVTAIPGVTSVSLTYNPSSSVAPVTYVATCSTSIDIKTGSSTTTSITLTGLTSGIEYTCTVKAVNVYGSSAPSAIRRITPS